MSDANTGGGGAARGTAARRTFTIERLLATTWKIFSGNAVPFLAVTFVFDMPSVVLTYVASRRMLAQQPGFLPLTYLAALLGIVERLLIVGTLTYAVYRALRRQPISWRDCFARGFAKFLPALGTAIVVGLATAVGFVLCLFPGLYVSIVYAVAIPAAVVEGGGVFAAMARSKTLTRGHIWPIFGTIFLLGLMLGIPTIAAQLLLADNLVARTAVITPLTIVGGTFQAVLSCVLYYQLREAVEDVDANELAAVFD